MVTNNKMDGNKEGWWCGLMFGVVWWVAWFDEMGGLVGG